MDLSKRSKHVAVLKRRSTGSVLRHPMASDEVELLSSHMEVVKGLIEQYYLGFELEYFEQIGMGNGSDG